MAGFDIKNFYRINNKMLDAEKRWDEWMWAKPERAGIALLILFIVAVGVILFAFL